MQAQEIDGWRKVAGGVFLLSVVACSSQQDPNGGQVEQAAPSATPRCAGVCVYQHNTTNSCETDGGTGPFAWFTDCQNVPCEEASFDSEPSISDPFSFCILRDVFRKETRFMGSCDDANRLDFQLNDANGRLPAGAECEGDRFCASGNCVGKNPSDFFCANTCEGGGHCDPGFVCAEGFCVPQCLEP